MTGPDTMPPAFVIPPDLKKKIEATIDQYQMLTPKEHVLAAVSGGPDSTALACILQSLSKKYRFTLEIAHLNHLLRGDEADKDEQFVKNLAKTLKLPIHVQRQDVKSHAKTHRQSIETAGRNLRYAFFKHLVRDHGYTRVATGHTLDDNAEQVLMNMLRGTGSKGLSGIPPVRQNLYIRPVIQTSKKQLMELLEINSQNFRTDSSNTDPVYLRNRIRNHLVPLLESEYNPEIVTGLNRLSQVMNLQEDFLEQETRQAFDSCLESAEPDSIVFSKQDLADLHPALLNRVLRKAVKILKKNLNRIALVHMTNMIHFCFKAGSGQSLDLPGQIRIYKTKDCIELKKEASPLREIGQQEKRKNRLYQKD